MKTIRVCANCGTQTDLGICWKCNSTVFKTIEEGRQATKPAAPAATRPADQPTPEVPKADQIPGEGQAEKGKGKGNK